ncbi:unnamed protein product (macronuclear) [Paramecium tetraurelia]|uniref:Uncharacterized protein n=1 Tax=Paramecium tetraurelia TaxID=5888 RepID=A0CIJ5_PARTE|nr:uncharacterized protein GSPATT00007747001 [Paramecium tetraurelia]CAK70612.1 unnamed protein product [Paramecium tetraurelia]|eukprot:XP_001438009.1 hypothetical protein (macronuclear) [Paramecium tetraurelia strain d4-2]
MLIIGAILISVELTLGKLTVIAPQELKQELDQRSGDIQYSIANFGNIPWGRRLSGTLDIANPLEACTELNQTVKSHFVLIKRGNCSFVKKVRQAQNAGYQLAIIEDDKGELNHTITMFDDGTGYGLQIPSIFISKQDGEILTKYLRMPKSNLETEQIQLLIKFDVRKKNNVTALFALNITSEETYKFLREFQPYYQKLKNEQIQYIVMYPLYQIVPNPDKPIEYQNCISYGKYCSRDPDGSGIATGRMVVEEILRQLCIFEQNSEKWLAYMISFRDNCTSAQQYESCSPLVQEEVGINQQKVEKCIRDQQESHSFSIKNETSNYKQHNILENQLYLWQASGVQQLPGIIINQQDYLGQITGANVFLDICYSFTTTPASCGEYIDGQTKQQDSSSNLYLTIGIIIFVMLIFFILLFCVYTRLIQKEFKESSQAQVNEMVTQYIQFYESKDKKSKEAI